MLEYAISVGRGGTYLKLTSEQYRARFQPRMSNLIHFQVAPGKSDYIGRPKKAVHLAH